MESRFRQALAWATEPKWPKPKGSCCGEEQWQPPGHGTLKNAEAFGKDTEGVFPRRRSFVLANRAGRC